MTKSKRVFAELLVQAQGHGDADEIAKTMSLVDIIYEMKKAEEAKTLKAPEPEPDAPPPVVELKKEASEKEAQPPSPPVTEEEEPVVIMKIKDFWSRLTHDSDTD
jgi:hypothetical protein